MSQMSTRIDAKRGASGPTGALEALIAAMEFSATVAPETAVEALNHVLNDIMASEGRTPRGRAHPVRTLDAQDAARCERILMAAGGRDGAPVTCAEAEMLFSIDAAATERSDRGRFDDLFVKALAHYVLATAGRNVPPRRVALSRLTPVATWASWQSSGDIDAEILVWIAAHVNNGKRFHGALPPAPPPRPPVKCQK
jgi:hypothetical protein